MNAYNTNVGAEGGSTNGILEKLSQEQPMVANIESKATPTPSSTNEGHAEKILNILESLHSRIEKFENTKKASDDIEKKEENAKEEKSKTKKIEEKEKEEEKEEEEEEEEVKKEKALNHCKSKKSMSSVQPNGTIQPVKMDNQNNDISIYDVERNRLNSVIGETYRQYGSQVNDDMIYANKSMSGDQKVVPASHPVSHIETLKHALKSMQYIKNVDQEGFYNTLDDLENLSDDRQQNRMFSQYISPMQSGFMKAVKSGYNTNVGAEGGFATHSITPYWMDRAYASGGTLPFVNIIPSVSKKTTITFTSELPNASLVPELASVDTISNAQMKQIDIELGSYYVISNLISRQAMNWIDNAFIQKLYETDYKRLAQILGSNILNGSGVDNIRGILTVQQVDVTNQTSPYLFPVGQLKVYKNGNTSAIQPDSLIRMIQKVPQEYRSTKDCVYVMHPDTLGLIRTLKDSQNRYLFNIVDFLQAGPVLSKDISAQQNGLGQEYANIINPEKEGATYSTLNGYRVVEDPFMPTVSAGAPVILFGNLKKSYSIIMQPGFLTRPVIVTSSSPSNAGIQIENPLISGMFVGLQAAGSLTNTQGLVCLIMSA